MEMEIAAVTASSVNLSLPLFPSFFLTISSTFPTSFHHPICSIFFKKKNVFK